MCKLMNIGIKRPTLQNIKKKECADPLCSWTLFKLKVNFNESSVQWNITIADVTKTVVSNDRPFVITHFSIGHLAGCLNTSRINGHHIPFDASESESDFSLEDYKMVSAPCRSSTDCNISSVICYNNATCHGKKMLNHFLTNYFMVWRKMNYRHTVIIGAFMLKQHDNFVNKYLCTYRYTSSEKSCTQAYVWIKMFTYPLLWLRFGFGQGYQCCATCAILEMLWIWALEQCLVYLVTLRWQLREYDTIDFPRIFGWPELLSKECVYHMWCDVMWTSLVCWKKLIKTSEYLSSFLLKASLYTVTCTLSVTLHINV